LRRGPGGALTDNGQADHPTLCPIRTRRPSRTATSTKCPAYPMVTLASNPSLA